MAFEQETLYLPWKYTNLRETPCDIAQLDEAYHLTVRLKVKCICTQWNLDNLCSVNF
jgi:hypothetical protein